MTQESESSRGESGLTTLEWLLITAAVAGLAALAVVLVTEQVEDTAGQVSDSEARTTAALHSALSVETDAKAADPGDFDSWSDWESHFSRKCELIAVLYADSDVEVVHNNFHRATGVSTVFDAAAAAYSAAADRQPATAAKAQAQCEVS